ncbi:hypothetical protein AB0K21_42295 [Streptosporangium sp. NPDC049248]|uniref:hypothetical protein n=1 Tax=Streptosporangium sp. NPDC049248 TaxID=3155651 RepID=UPI00343AC7CE
MKTPAKTPGQAAQHGLGLWWSILILSTTVSITLNLWHALTMKADAALIKDACQVSAELCKRAARVADEVVGLHPVLGVIFAIVPPVFAGLLSHGLINPVIGAWIKNAILGLFGISMATSVVSQAAVMQPYGGGYMAEWSIPLVLDASALIALHVITKSVGLAHELVRQVDAEAELEAIRAEQRPAIEAEVRAELTAELAAAEAELRAELSARQAELTADAQRNYEAEITAARTQIRAELGAELTAVRTRLEQEAAQRQASLEAAFDTRLAETKATLRRDAEAEIAERIRRAEVETEGRIRLELAKDAKPKTKTDTPAKKTDEPSLNRHDKARILKEKARILLAEMPEITGAELGRALDVSDRYGRDLLREMSEEKQQEPAPALVPDVRLRAVP